MKDMAFFNLFCGCYNGHYGQIAKIVYMTTLLEIQQPNEPLKMEDIEHNISASNYARP